MLRRLIFTLTCAGLFALALVHAHADDLDWAKQVGTGYDLPASAKATKVAPTKAPRDYAAEMDAWFKFTVRDLGQKMPLPNCSNLDPCQPNRSALVILQVDRRGSILDMRFNRSSGSETFDLGVMGALRRANPLVPPPLPPQTKYIQFSYEAIRGTPNSNGATAHVYVNPQTK